MREDVPPPRSGAAGLLQPGSNNVKLIYVLYIASIAFGITALVGLVLAYMNRGRGGPVADSHYTYIIRTFWIGLLYALVSAFLALVLIGFVLMALVAVWAILRCGKGLMAIGREEPIADPDTWMI